MVNKAVFFHYLDVSWKRNNHRALRNCHAVKLWRSCLYLSFYTDFRQEVCVCVCVLPFSSISQKELCVFSSKEHINMTPLPSWDCAAVTHTNKPMNHMHKCVCAHTNAYTHTHNSGASGGVWEQDQGTAISAAAAAFINVSVCVCVE